MVEFQILQKIKNQSKFEFFGGGGDYYVRKI
jgi:hypothetical protein